VRIDSESAGAAYITGWLRGRYGDVEERGGRAGHRRWRVLRTSPFEVEVSDDALDQDRVQLREWLETVAEDAADDAPDPPGNYRLTRADGVTKSVAGAAHRPVPASG
jgi:hypothetical protein